MAYLCITLRYNNTLIFASFREHRTSTRMMMVMMMMVAGGLLQELILHPGPNHLGQLQLGDAAQDLQPGAAQVVAVRVGHRDQGLDRLNVLGLDVGDG